MMQEIQKSISIHEFVAYYRELRPEKFSDSKIEYEIPLTEELFEKQLEILSTKKMQSNFENFIVRCAERLLTPNIKPQTEPDGGGDGKVDAETYEVTTDISDKWYIADGGASEKDKWAFAISCKKQWKPKVTGDIEKIANTNRGYTRALFFSNQFIKSSTRVDIEKDLSNKFNIEVSIFDALWCINAVFHHGCKDIALDCLNFSDEYKIFEVLTISPEVYIEITETNDKSELKQLVKSNEYLLCINKNYSDKDMWECISMFIAFFFSRNSMSKEDLMKMLQNKQDGEKLMDRVSNLLQVKQSISNILPLCAENTL